MLVIRRLRAHWGLLAVLAVAVAGLAVPQPASAAAAPWRWKIVESAPFTIAPKGYGAWSAQCPSGWIPISGGVAPHGSIGNTWQVNRTHEYANPSPVSGAAWTVGLENVNSDRSVNLKIVAHCVLASDVPSLQFVEAQVTRNVGTHQEGTVWCPDGYLAIGGGVDWSNVNTRVVNHTGPTGGGNGWYAIGWNNQSDATMYIVAACVSASEATGAQLVQREYAFRGSAWEQAQATATCPAGKRVLSGGTEPRFWDTSNFPGIANGSWPDLNAWQVTTRASMSNGVAYVRVWCVSAGNPTFNLQSTIPHGSQTNNKSIGFALTGSDPAGSTVSYRCSLDGSAPGGCPAAPLYTVADGQHTFVAWAVTPDGRNSSTVTHQWTVDTLPPALTLKTLPSVALTSPVTHSWTATDGGTGVKAYAAEYRRASYYSTFGSWTQPDAWKEFTTPSVSMSVLGGQTVCFRVYAWDKVLNKTTSAVRCTSKPLDDRSLSATSSWKRITGSSYMFGTATESKGLGAKLTTSSSARLNRVGILATKCSTCGKVSVYVGSTLIGTINLYRSTTQHKAVVMLPSFATKTGKVTLKVATSGKLVRIDGLVIGQTPPPDAP